MEFLTALRACLPDPWFKGINLPLCIGSRIPGLALLALVYVFGIMEGAAFSTTQDCDDHAFRTAFMLATAEAYERGNSPEEHYLDFQGGLREVEAFLRSKIGTT